MTSSGSPPLVGTLRRLMRPAAAAPATERCELCGVELPPFHRHMLDAQTKRLLCACRVCGEIEGRTTEARYRPVPSRYLRLPSRPVLDADWSALSIPVDLAFFLFSSGAGRVIGFYPGPAGLTESHLQFETWPLLDAPSQIDRIAPDTEALLVRRTAGALACFIVPIDACYDLAGRIRSHWTGLNGGDEVRREIDRFFAALLEKTAGAAGDTW
jgi:hypothetical protein